MRHSVIRAFAALICSCTIPAQIVPGSGHWEGTIDLPQRQVKVAVDLERRADGKWGGWISFPDSPGEAAILDSVSVKPGSIAGLSRESLYAFDCTRSADGQSLKGGFISASLRKVPAAVLLKRTGDARVPRARPSNGKLSTASAGLWEGELRILKTWEGDDPAHGTVTRLQVKFAAGPDGAGSGTLTKLPEGETAAALIAVSEQGNRIRFELPSGTVVFEGVREGDEIAGEWSQFNADPVKLVLRRAKR